MKFCGSMAKVEHMNQRLFLNKTGPCQSYVHTKDVINSSRELVVAKLLD